MQSPRENSVSSTPRPVRPPSFLIELEPWPRVFLRNLRDTVRPRIEPLQMLTSRPAPFWPDVFVTTGIPRRPLAQSVLYHVFVVVALWGLSHTFIFGPRAPRNVFFKDQKITYYDVSEYLPAIDTGSEPAKEAKKGEPEYARQPIISIPRHPDNSTQTIVDPVHPVQLHQEQRLPNMVVWTQVPAPPVLSQNLARLITPPDIAHVAPPAPAPSRDLSKLAAAQAGSGAVPPAPDAANPDLKLPAASPGAVAPAPDVAPRNLGEINVGHSEFVVMNPALPMPEQRAANLIGGASASALGTGGAAVPPAPSADSGGGAGLKAQGQFVALSVRPAPPDGPIDGPAGNRRGIFAATPAGHPGAAGTPDIKGGGNGHGGAGNGGNGPGAGTGSGTGPAGIYVGGNPASAGSGAVVAAAPPPAPVSPPATGNTLKQALIAALAPRSVADLARETAPGSTISRPDSPGASRIEDKVFGPKKYYSMILNMPNLTSAGGSWILRFAELKQSGDKGELTAPVATSKADPAYPPELMRKNVEGTVALYAVIHADGTVGEIRVLESVDDKLDANARDALARWHFRPATKNGNAVDLEAVVFIPFRIRKVRF